MLNIAIQAMVVVHIFLHLLHTKKRYNNFFGVTSNTIRLQGINWVAESVILIQGDPIVFLKYVGSVWNFLLKG